MTLTTNYSEDSDNQAFRTLTDTTIWVFCKSL